MRKIKTVFAIDRTTHRATDEVIAQWVLDGEGVATVKLDGTSCAIRGGKLFRRYDAKNGKTPPEGWEPCEAAPDPVTHHWPGWLPVEGDPAGKYHREAFDANLPDGTYELVGPKVQQNRYGLDRHELRPHGAEIVEVERTREALVAWLEANHAEGLVFHRGNGDMAKLRRKDFGLRW